MPASAPPRTRSGGKTSPGGAGVGAALDGRAHPPQRLGHAPHRPPGQRGVAVAAPSRTAARRAAPSRGGWSSPNCRSRAAPRPRRGPRSRRRARAPRRRRSDVDAQRPQRRTPSTGCRRRAPGPRASTTPSRERAEQQRAVGDRLVAGNAAGPAQRSGSPDCQRLGAHRCFTTTSAIVRSATGRVFGERLRSTASTFSASPSRLLRADVQAHVDARSLGRHGRP